jgi:hypothetical protein
METTMRTASQCRDMAARMERNAALVSGARLNAEWLAMAACWRDLAYQSNSQDASTASRR